MRTNKTNVYELYGELYDSNESVGVTFDVKNIVLIANAVNTVKGFLYLGKALPFAFFDYCHPFLQSNLRIRMRFRVFFQCLFCKYSHRLLFLYGTKVMIKFISQNLILIFLTRGLRAPC